MFSKATTEAVNSAGNPKSALLLPSTKSFETINTKHRSVTYSLLTVGEKKKGLRFYCDESFVNGRERKKAKASKFSNGGKKKG